MKTFDRSDLSLLLEERPGPCVSAFVPTVINGPQTQQNPIQFKNTLRDAEEKLIGTGMRSTDARALLAPAEPLLDDRQFWEHQGAGLALFAAPGLFHYYRLPLNVPAEVTVDQHFHLRPLLPLLTGDGRFFVLALDQQGFRILECSRDHFRVLHAEEVPATPEDAEEYMENTEQLEWHTYKPETRGERLALQHGQGTRVDDKKDRLMRYFHDVDARVRSLLPPGREPLVLAAIAEYFTPYRAANDYPGLLEDGVTCGPKGMQDQDLHREAWPIVHEHFDQDRRQAWDRYNQVAGIGRTSTDPRAVLVAAWDGRVDTLFLADGARLWGRFDPLQRSAQVFPGPGPGGEDLLDLAAFQTLRHDGPVYVQAQADMPDGQPLAAFFRY